MLGERIRSERRRKKKTQEELAQYLGVNRSVISKYETGSITPALNQIKKISEFLNIPLGDLLGDETIRTIEIPMPDYHVRVISEEELSRMAPSEREYYILRLLSDIDPERISEELEQAFNKLNKLGQVESVIRTRELAECSKFTQEDPNNTPLSIMVSYSDKGDKKGEK